jgi:hypothetical protein
MASGLELGLAVSRVSNFRSRLVAQPCSFTTRRLRARLVEANSPATSFFQGSRYRHGLVLPIDIRPTKYLVFAWSQACGQGEVEENPVLGLGCLVEKASRLVGL